MTLSENTEVEESPSAEETKVTPRVKWDRKAIKRKIEEADDFISKACKFLPKHLKKTDSDEENDSEEEEQEENNEVEADENDEGSDDEDDNNEEKPKKSNGVAQKSRAKTIAELHKRLAELKEKKGGGYADKLLKKGLKNRIRKKQKLEERRKQKLLSKKIKGGGNLVKTNSEEIKQEPQTRNIKPIYNAEGNMVFSKFDFTDSRVTKKTDKDPKRALQRIEKVKSKIQKLEEAGQVEKVVDLKEKQLWKSAIQRAEGVKVKDNEELLKKSIKKKQHQKNKSKKQWEQREEQVKKKKEDAQKKRKENIGQRKKEKKQKKIKKAIKKGRMVPQ